MQGLYGYIDCSSATNAMDKGSISGLMHLDVWEVYYSLLLSGFTVICIELFLCH